MTNEKGRKKEMRGFKREAMTNRGETGWTPISSPSVGEKKKNKPAWELEPRDMPSREKLPPQGILLGFWGKVSELLFQPLKCAALNCRKAEKETMRDSGSGNEVVV